MDEITLIHTGLAWKVGNFIFYHFWKLKDSLYTQTFEYMPWTKFSSFKAIFLNAPNNFLFMTH